MTITSISASAVVAFDAAELKATLTRLRPLISNNRCAPALQAVRVDFDGEHATLTATNLDNTLRIRLAAPSLGAGSFLVPFARLAKVLNVHSKGTVTLEAEGDVARIRFDRSTVNVATPPIDEYPPIPTVAGRRVPLNLDALADVLPAASTDDTRPILCAVFVDDGRYVTTDSYRLYIADTNRSGSTGEFLLNRDTVALAVRYHKGQREAIVGEKAVQVELDENTTLIGRLVEGMFPAYKNLIPREGKVIVTLGPSFPKDLKQLTKLGVGAPSGPLKVLPSDRTGEVLLQVGSGDDMARTACEGSTELEAVGWNPQYLLALVDGMSNLDFHGVDSLKPSCLRDDAPHLGAGVTRTRLIMPVRVS